MIPKRTIVGTLIALLLVSFAASPASADPNEDGQRDVGTLGACIWDNVITWDAGSSDNGSPYRIPGWDDSSPVSDFYITSNKCADINISLSSRPQPAQTIGVRACIWQTADYVCNSWKYWGPGFSGWLELNDQQPSVPDGKPFWIEMYGVDPYTVGYVAF